MANQDYETIQRVLSGDKRAYAALVDRHKDRAMTLALRMLKNREDAEEALQDAFVRAFLALSGFEWKSSFSTWFYRIVFNVCSTRLSRRGEEQFVSTDEEDEEGYARELPSSDETPDRATERLDEQRIVQEAIANLPVVYGTMLTLFLVQDMSYEEIVDVTGLPLGTVKVRLFRARDLLRKSVAERMREQLHTESVKSVGVRK
jgi:RNA polymerase sigma-70 factor (ECF subfamily)